MGKQNPKIILHCIENLNLPLNEINTFLKAKGIRLFYSAESTRPRPLTANWVLLWNQRLDVNRLIYPALPGLVVCARALLALMLPVYKLYGGSPNTE
jgi:hypothetical protein